jgi:tetratricopeptide (TPR) repeat protein
VELNRVMVENLTGLGLPRRQSEGCLYCHVGSMEQPVGSWDFASDARPAKQTARTMMRMVAAINDTHLASLEHRVAPGLVVTCQTCHAGRTDPRPLPDVLWDTYDNDGIEAALDRYVRLRDRYFGGDAYDFRVNVLPVVAARVAATGDWDGALAVADANIGTYPDSGYARQVRLTLTLDRLVTETSVDAVLDEFAQVRRSDDGRYVTPALLDGLGWTLARRGRLEGALALFAHNRALYPDEYVPMESLADGLWQSGDRQQALEMFEAWLVHHPDHEMARRRLTNLRERAAR